MFKFFLKLFTGKGLSVQVRGDRLMVVYKGEFSDKQKNVVEQVLQPGVSDKKLEYLKAILSGSSHARAFPTKKGDRGFRMEVTE